MKTDVSLSEDEKKEMRVLLIDDSPSLLDQAKLFLEQADERLKAETTTSAKEGLKLLEEEDFDATIVDYKMPEMDGLELLKKLRDRDDDIPFIILTGKGNEEVAMEALNQGADRYFKKSGDPKDRFKLLAQETIQEITQKRLEKKWIKSQKELSKERTLLESLLNNLPISIYFKNTQGEHIRASQHLVDSLDPEQAETKSDVIGKTDFDLYPDELAEKSAEDDKRVMETREPVVNREEHSHAPDGSDIYHLTTKAPLVDEDDNVIGVMGFSQEITERKKAQEKLAREKNLLEGMLENFPASIYIKNREGEHVRISRRLREDLRENGHEEIIGKTDIELYPEKGRKTYEENMHVMETEEPIINKEYSIEDSEGNKSYYSTSKAPVYDNDNNVIGLVGVTQEITKRKQLQERLDFESSLLNDLLENVPASIYFKDAECRFVEVSDFKAEELGMDRAEVVGKTDFDFYSEDRAQEMFEDDKRVMEEEEPVVNKEEKIVTPDGEEWWASVIKVPRYDEDGNVIGTLGISMDITERKQGEQREDFLHSLLSNDIETKNKTAVGILELLKERDISEQEKSMIDTAINSIEDSSELISRVWTLRKASRKTELSEVDLDSKINSAVESNAELLEDKEIDTEIGETENEVKGGRLTEDLFSNLIEWIVRFGECNVLRVRTREENGRITIILEGDGQEVPEMIRRGITKDFREGQVKEGGMLIYLASTISTAYKGKFEIKESELGGARFDVTLRKL